MLRVAVEYVLGLLLQARVVGADQDEPAAKPDRAGTEGVEALFRLVLKLEALQI